MMINKNHFLVLIFLVLTFQSCKKKNIIVSEEAVFPVIVTDTTINDTDDPAIWYNKREPGNSLILGTDKGDSTGGIFVFNMDGKINKNLSLYNLKRPNNIDVEYGFKYLNKKTDIAVFTERGRDMIRVISLPDCRYIDNGGIPVFEDDTLKEPMGISLYKDNEKNVYAFVGRKTGPLNGYIYQYLLFSNDSFVIAKKVRAFGKFSGIKEIEAIVVDDELGVVYYSDENAGVRKYYADVDKGDEELAFFAQTGITGDQEGLSIYKQSRGRGYIILSDQQANKFHLFNRKADRQNPNSHQLVRIVSAQTNESDGSDILNMPFNDTFPGGVFVAMSSNKTFQFYKAEDIIGKN